MFSDNLKYDLTVPPLLEDLDYLPISTDEDIIEEYKQDKEEFYDTDL